ncbi:hypothetical protein TNCT_462981 [Trichonephila clavata]|uniref:Secreted protein n=1 Tax=Trichonephila clavata TaxID=2740835 RepID=A0A8X6M4P7_TRICU|nr:hypothetical protein TNCT_462981 [Trichonephila clavata]
MDGDPKLCFASFYSCFFFCCCFSGATETLDSSQRWLFNVSETSGGFLFSMEGVFFGGKGIAEDSPLAGTSGGSNYRKNAEKRECIQSFGFIIFWIQLYGDSAGRK